MIILVDTYCTQFDYSNNVVGMPDHYSFFSTPKILSLFAAKPHYDDEIVNAFFEESDFLIDGRFFFK